MLDKRVRVLLADYQKGSRGLEETAQRLMSVRRETGCLELQIAPSAGPAERALVARFVDLVRLEAGARPDAGPPENPE